MLVPLKIDVGLSSPSFYANLSRFRMKGDDPHYLVFHLDRTVEFLQSGTVFDIPQNFDNYELVAVITAELKNQNRNFHVYVKYEEMGGASAIHQRESIWYFYARSGLDEVTDEYMQMQLRSGHLCMPRREPIVLLYRQKPQAERPLIPLAITDQKLEPSDHNDKKEAMDVQVPVLPPQNNVNKRTHSDE